MWELDWEEGWAPKSWCFQTVVLEKTLESPLDSKETKPVNPKGNHLWILIGRTDTEAEAPIFWSPDANSQLIGKDPDAGNDWGQEEKEMPEDEMVGWHHRLDGHGFGWTGVDDGQGGLGCCGHEVAKSRTWLSDWTALILVAQMVKHLPAMLDTFVQSLGQEDPLEKEIGTRSSILAWRTLWTEEPREVGHGVTKSWTWLSD